MTHTPEPHNHPLVSNQREVSCESCQLRLPADSPEALALWDRTPEHLRSVTITTYQAEPQEMRQEPEDCKACSGTGGNVGPAGWCGVCEGRGYYRPSSPQEPQTDEGYALINALNRYLPIHRYDDGEKVEVDADTRALLERIQAHLQDEYGKRSIAASKARREPQKDETVGKLRKAHSACLEWLTNDEGMSAALEVISATESALHNFLAMMPADFREPREPHAALIAEIGKSLRACELWIDDDSGLDGAIELLDSHVMPSLRRCLHALKGE